MDLDEPSNNDKCVDADMGNASGAIQTLLANSGTDDMDTDNVILHRLDSMGNTGEGDMVGLTENDQDEATGGWSRCHFHKGCPRRCR